MIFCNSTNGSVRLVLPDVSLLQLYVSCKFHVRRINNSNNQIDIVGYSSSTNNVYDSRNNKSNQAAAIGTGCVVMLFQQAWYVGESY